MASPFTTKKIKIKQSLGERFRSTRKRKKLTISEAEIGTKVRAKYLEAIEKGDWKELPQTVYVRGFVLSYAKYLELDTDEILKQFYSEIAIRDDVKSEDKISYNQTIDQKKVLITPKLIGYCALATFVLSMSAYIVVQLNNFTGNPVLTITQPDNNAVYDSDTLNIAGVTDGGAVVMVNDEDVPVTSEGKFSLNMKLRRGVNVIKVKAVNKINKETSAIYTVEYKPKTASIQGTQLEN